MSSEVQTSKLQHFLKINSTIDLSNNSNRANRPWFWANEVANIYKIPPPTDNNVVVAVVSFGGGLYGNVDASGNLTNSDVEKYWLSLGISPSNIPKVIVKAINGAVNAPNDRDNGETMENTIDVETIGACCPTSKLTIVLYISPNDLTEFPRLIQFILNDSISPNVISISWGASEIYYGSNLLNSLNNLFSIANRRGINITAATGDYGSNDGVGGKGSYCNFPSSSPNVTAVGGTNLKCPNLTYDNKTFESAWTSGGGAISKHFNNPAYQKSLKLSKRSTPDLAALADPNTGINYLLNGRNNIVGGTSIASPLISGFLAAINMKTFINPLIYSSSKVCFNDIVFGSNGNYRCKIGYDNCTGMGTIKGNMINFVNSATINTTPSIINIPLKSKLKLSVTSNLSANLLTYSSNNNNVKIDNSGNITGNKIGKSIITVNTPNYNIFTTITVTVSIAPNKKNNAPNKKNNAPNKKNNASNKKNINNLILKAFYKSNKNSNKNAIIVKSTKIHQHVINTYKINRTDLLLLINRRTV